MFQHRPEPTGELILFFGHCTLGQIFQTVERHNKSGTPSKKAMPVSYPPPAALSRVTIVVSKDFSKVFIDTCRKYGSM